MPALGNRRQAIKRNITGGTSAPPAAAKGPTTGLANNNQQAKSYGWGSVLKPGAAKDTAYGKNPGQFNQGAPAPAGAAQAPATPWDLQAANSEAGAQRKLGNSLTGLDAGWLRTQQDFGLEGPWADPASNPTSRAALLQRSYDNAKRGSMNSAGRNLYAGSYINAQNQNTHQFNLGRNDLQNAYAEANAQYVGGRAGAEDEARETMNQAGCERVYAGLNAPLEPAPAGAKPGAKKPQPKKPQQPRKQQIKANIAPARGGTRKIR
jgi:hypothetical protein